MGIFKAVGGAVSGMWGEQWKEYFYCDALPDEVLLRREFKRIGNRSTNTRADDDVITEGSLFVVADGQAVIVVSRGRVVDVCTEPGEHEFHDDSRGRGLGGVFKELGNRIAFGGDVQPVTQRVYYVNTKEVMGNPFTTPQAISYRMTDGNIALDADSGISLSGIYSYKIADPAAFYRQVSGNVTGAFTRASIASRMTSELLTALQPAVARLSGMGLRPSELPEHTKDLADALNASMNTGWCGQCGLAVVSVGIAGMTITDHGRVTELQMNATLKDPVLREAYLAGMAAQAVKTAAENGNPVGMAAAAAVGSRAMGESAPMKEKPAPQGFGTDRSKWTLEGARARQSASRYTQDGQVPGSWTCACGTVNTGAFCHECGKKRPLAWKCVCGTVNTGNFCAECGRKKP